jgi:hypothetical protein
MDKFIPNKISYKTIDKIRFFQEKGKKTGASN